MTDYTGAAALAQRPAQQPKRFPIADQIAVSLLWFAFFANWLTMVPVIIPDQIASILGPDAAAKEGISGSILAIGAFMALVMAPLAGALSDRIRNAKGRRRPFLIAGWREHVSVSHCSCRLAPAAAFCSTRSQF